MNLIEEARSYLGAGVVQRASTLVGESPEGTRRALDTAVPTLVAGLAGEISRTRGATNLLRVVSDAGLEGPRSSISERLGAASGEELVALGKDLLGRVFGGRMSDVAEAAAGSTGVRVSSMTSLLGLAAPLVLGALGSVIHARHLDGAGLAGFLGAQRDAAASDLPASVEAALHPVPPARPPPARMVSAPSAVRSGPRFWPLLLAVPLAIVVGLLLRRPRTTASEDWGMPRRFGVGLIPSGAQRPAPVPEQASPEPQRGGVIVGELSEFLASPNAEASKRFLFEDLHFELATPNLVPASLATLDGVAEVLKLHPNVRIVVEGHTDATGVPADNQRLSQLRADAVKSALVMRGVDAERIGTVGFGQDRPVASNDTTAGRARNRRTELLVTR